MKRSTMIRGLAALAVCALLPLAWARQKNPVPRPFKMQAHSQMVVSPVDYSTVATWWGEATHCGKCVSFGWGWFNPLAWELIGSGTIIAANNDEIFYDYPNTIQTVITGGTGRFEGATGEFKVVSMDLTGMETDLEAGTMTLCFVWTASGTICY